MNINEIIAEELQVKVWQVEAAVKLIDEGNTIPFIARYRKPVTGELNDEQLRDLDERLKYLRNLEEKKETVIASIEEQGKMTDELMKQIKEAKTIVAVDDIYRPYRPKRKTRATEAKAKGLEPLANIFLLQKSEKTPEEEAKNYINEELGVETVVDAINGAKDIIAEAVSDNAEYRNAIRHTVIKHGNITSKAKNEEEQTPYENYYAYSEAIDKIPGHRILAINRGEKEKVLNVKIEMPDENIIRVLEKSIIVGQNPFSDVLKEAIEDGFTRLIKPAIEREIRNYLTEKAEDGAISVFGQNLKQLLMQPPIAGKTVLGWDPAFRTGCKLAIVDETGKVLYTKVIFPTAPQNKVEESIKIVLDIVKKYNVSLISLGNGTASRESEAVVCEIIKRCPTKLEYVIVNEAGASVYSASQIAKEEFPDYHVEERSAVSIARRLQDPLAELVKIEPKAISVGQYQHDIPEKDLEEQLDFVVEKTVNNVGVDINTASKSLLKYVAGLNAGVAQQIVLYRNEHGKFHNRNEIKNVKKLGAKTYTQAIGFLRILDGDLPLDATAIHPENYQQALDLLNLCQLSLADLGTVELKDKLLKINKKEVIETLKIDQYTLDDIIDCLIKPNRSIRDQYQTPLLKKDILHIEDLKPGMVLEGTVRNVVDFGAFVDIGLKNDGLVHISKMSKQRIKHPLDVLSIGDIVEVNVIDVDLNKKRVSLSMI